MSGIQIVRAIVVAAIRRVRTLMTRLTRPGAGPFLAGC